MKAIIHPSHIILLVQDVGNSLVLIAIVRIFRVPKLLR